MSALTERMIRAARLDVNLYEEVEADKNTMGQATTVVVLSSIAAGIGTFSRGGVLGIITITLGTFLGWYMWAYFSYFIGTRLLAEPQTKADLGELLRTIGFSSSPGLIRILRIVPSLHGLVFWVAEFWMIVSMIVAVRQALDYTSTWRAVTIVAIGWMVQVLLVLLLLLTLGEPKPPM